MEKSKKITLLSCIILMGFFFSIVYHFTISHYIGIKNPFDSFLWGADVAAFNDFTSALLVIKDMRPYDSVDLWINYFPLAYLILYPCCLFTNPLLVYGIYALSFFSFFLIMNIKNVFCENLSRIQNFQNILIFSCLSYPAIMLIDRGNFDLFLFVVFAFFILSIKEKKFMKAAILLGIQNACKPFALFFLALFLFEKKYKEFFISCGLSLVLILGGFLIFKGGFINQISIFSQNLVEFKNAYLYNLDNCGMFASSSLYMSLKLLLTRMTAQPLIDIDLFINIYSIFSACASIIILYFSFCEKTFWKKITLLTLQMLVLPFLTNDYKLIFLYLPIWLFINEKKQTKTDWLYATLFGLLIIPKSILFITPALKETYGFYYGSVSLIMNSFLMMFFIGFIIFEQLKQKRKLKNNE